MDLVHTLERYDCFLSLPTAMSWVYQSPTRSCFLKQLAELLDLKMLVVDVLSHYGSGLGGNIPFNFLFCQFDEDECPAAYQGDFVDLEKHWTFYRR